MGMRADTRPEIDWPQSPHIVPREVFDREDIYQAELERIFYGPVWHPVCHEAEIPNPHDFKTLRVGERPVLMTRDEQGQVHAFLNACTHRGTLLATRSLGNAAQGHECPYHRWVFDSAGALRVCPGEDDFIEGFRREDFALPRLRMEQHFGLMFVTFSEHTPPLATFLADMGDTMRMILGGDGRLRLLGYQKVSFNANWKVYFDQDGWHAPMLHAAFQMLRWTAGKGSLLGTRYGHRNCRYEIIPLKEVPMLKDASVIEYRVRPEDGGQLAILFPTTNMNKQMDTMTIRYAIPRGPDRTEVHYSYFAHADDDAEMARHRLRQASNMLGPSGFISLEDGAVFNRIQDATGAGGLNHMIKGMHLDRDPYTQSQQNDEMQSIVFWNYYKELMGFA